MIGDLLHMSSEIDRLEAENERLRAALEKIVAKGHANGEMVCAGIAYDALAKIAEMEEGK